MHPSHDQSCVNLTASPIPLCADHRPHGQLKVEELLRTYLSVSGRCTVGHRVRGGNSHLLDLSRSLLRLTHRFASFDV